ncbi:MAG: hypothetical protein MUC88_05715 [Planctomycetes bacterium]|jgi:hypothetical protein|nr:hypothetical protein [Planctomycetota bacterium]
MHNRISTTQIWSLVARGTLAVGLLSASVAICAGARAASPHHQFLGGPWEVFLKLGMEGAGVRVPLSIADENQPQNLSVTVPVMGTPIQVQLERYVPDLKWETRAVDDPNAGPAARLSLRGESLQQDLWLCARERERQSISAHIGSVAMRELPSSAGAQLLSELTEPEVVGVLLLWPSEKEAPLVYPARPGKTVTIPGSAWGSPTHNSALGTPWQVSVLRYVPHYSIDRQTKEVTSQSDKPENPAVEVRVEGEQREHKQWLWSQFSASPHRQQELPFRIRFVDFPVGGKGAYILAMTPGAPPQLLCLQDGKKRLMPVELGKRYSFDDQRYSFAVDEVRPGARIETTWKNGSDLLVRPALVATIRQGASAQQVVLELGQPCHQKTNVGTLVALYRRVPQ